ncbi:sulfite exporter TauE/SafE family protein [Desulfosporosinus meridiei]|uniref:Probable membrane transporter protein n=1 Tax=Desulfosporosinus meridiei (strain ATCC BAA-275 / DSM 13257 / KCTC 12902 / NCIMB 13706 / S10) TaxID=768704 RepID=J7IM93_DESMD|nr:sulfite exporter TauE/SafE family protein [Desulfosporosinus meridiei]AFQ42710.1 putative permease [Desulfosporosinus meridiei DSM 13257]
MAGEAVNLVGEVMRFIDITPKTGLSMIGLGFLGGTLSGFLGSGGAFVMTPGMMALGVPGIAAVSSNLAHKFGKAMVGARKHSKMGNVDVKLGVFMVAFLLLGVRLAVILNESIFASMGKEGSNLYISVVFVVLLSGLSVFILRDISKPNSNKGSSEPSGLAAKLSSLNIPPMIYFKVANVRVSLWLVAIIGLATGWLAGTVGVGGFIGVPAMIYLLGIPTMVAAGTELFLAIFSGASGSFQYAMNGFVDIRLVLLLYLGSLLGLHIGANATKMVTELQIKFVMAMVIGMSALSRAFAIPKYLTDLHMMNLSNGVAGLLDLAATVTLYGGAIIGVLMIIRYIVRYKQASKVNSLSSVQSTLKRDLA